MKEGTRVGIVKLTIIANFIIRIYYNSRLYAHKQNLYIYTQIKQLVLLNLIEQSIIDCSV